MVKMAKLTTTVPAFRGEYAWLSNMAKCLHGIVYDGVSYPSTEHAYVAAKVDFGGTLEQRDTWEVAWKDMTPYDAKKYGQQIQDKAGNWRMTNKLTIMENLLRQKFSAPYYRNKLIATGNKEIEELNYWKDTYWGICNGVGENHLGKLLMKIRAELFEKKKE